MDPTHLTDDQRKLLEELRLIHVATGVEFEALLNDPSRADWITADLRDSLELIVRGYLVTEYTLFDEIMNRFMLGYLCGEDSRDELGKITDPRAEDITHYILESTYLLKKWALYKKLHKPPPWVASFVQALNDLRNGAAHTFVVETRRVPMAYKGIDIFTWDGIRAFAEDRRDVMQYFEEQHPYLIS